MELNVGVQKLLYPLDALRHICLAYIDGRKRHKSQTHMRARTHTHT